MLPIDTHIRPATPPDCDVILQHRRSMFRDMCEGSPEELDTMVEASRSWLLQSMTEGSYRGWLVETGLGKVVAGGGILISSWPPRPEDSNPRRALIVNVYTEPEFRKQGLARELMLLMIRWLREQGFRAVSLHASSEGRHLYEALGFEPTNEMRLQLAPAD